MELKDHLTNEEIRGKFNNQFDLVNYAIKLVADMIQTGRAPRTATHTENPALQVLEEIVTGQDKFEELPKEKGKTEYHDVKEVKEAAKEVVEAEEEEAQTVTQE